MTVSNESIYRRMIEEGFNQGNLAVVDELVAPDVVWAKLSALTEGARLASRRLWGRVA